MSHKKKTSPTQFTLWITLAGCVLLFSFILAGMGFWMQHRAMAVGMHSIHRVVDEYRQSAPATLRRISEAGVHNCRNVLPLLTSFATLTPYTRSADIISSETVVCSSFSGDASWLVNNIFPYMRVSNGYLTAVTISSSSLHSNRADSVIVYTRLLQGNVYTFTVKNIRYIQDLIEVMTGNNHLNYVLLVGNGRPVFLGYAWDGDNPLTSLEIQTDDISVTVYSTFSSWLYFIPIILPAFLILLFLSCIFWKQRHAARIFPASVIHRAMKEGEFFVCYQPVCDDLGRCRGAEALMRWKRADGRLIPPDVFVPAAESENMMAPLTRHLMRLIANDVKQWIPTREFHLSINISSEHLSGDEFIEDIRVFRDNLPPALSLVVEITERTFIEDTEKTVAHLSLLREAGIKVAIDDFGTGYCSLSILQILPADYLKIDRCFTETIDFADGSPPVLDAIIALSKRLNLTMIAEGVSTKKQVLFMKNHQVLLLQGFLFSRPLDAVDFWSWYHGNVDETNLS